MTAKVQLRHPDPTKTAASIDTDKYEIMRNALLEIIPADRPGIPFKGLADRVAGHLPPDTLVRIGAIGWYTTAVKLDLEAQGLIERVPDRSPQRIRRPS